MKNELKRIARGLERLSFNGIKKIVKDDEVVKGIMKQIGKESDWHKEIKKYRFRANNVEFVKGSGIRLFKMYGDDFFEFIYECIYSAEKSDGTDVYYVVYCQLSNGFYGDKKLKINYTIPFSTLSDAKRRVKIDKGLGYTEV